MRYLKRSLQILFVFAIIWLTYANADRTVSMVFFTREIRNASVIIVIAISLLSGSLLTSFFAALRELRNAKKYRETEKENVRLKKELDDAVRDLRLAKIDLQALQAENNSFKKLIDVANKNNSTGIIL